jgi:predicted anti-sigma-YlaC factor YlaD
MGGSPEHARQDYERALALSGGHDAGLFVSWAMSVAVPAQDRPGFDAAIERALAVDADATPANRLANLVAQQRALFLKRHADDLFL